MLLAPNTIFRRTPEGAKGENFVIEKVEKYMDKHQFLDADKKKVRDFLRTEQATDAYLTRKELYFISGDIPGVVGRSQLGLQDNFV